MKDAIKDFLKLFGNGLVVITLMLSAYLLLINLYHYNDLNQKYLVDLTKNDSYISFKESVSKIEEKIKQGNALNVGDSNRQRALSSMGSQLNRCITLIKEGSFYNIEKKAFSQTDIYYYNNELSGNLSSQCFNMVIYYAEESIKEVGGFDDFTQIAKETNERKEELTYYSNYLKNVALSNTNYRYTTATSRTTIFNDIQSYFNLTNKNYDSFIKEVDKLASWYLLESGGAR